MSLVVLLDASPQITSEVPLSWWCAAELAQWPSAAMTIDVFHFTLSGYLRRMSRERNQQNSNSKCASSTTNMIVDINSNNNNSVYLFLPFPQTIKATNKYFTTEIQLLCGFYIDREYVHESNNHRGNEQQEEWKATYTESNNNVLIQKLNEIILKYNDCSTKTKTKVQSQRLNVECEHDINTNSKGVGIVYLTSSTPHVELQRVLWELFTQSPSALKAVMYFNREIENEINSKMNNVSKWHDVCVDAEIELIVHECEETPSYSEKYHRLNDNRCEDKTDCNCTSINSINKEIKWEKVSAHVGKLSILSSPVTGSNRLMQLLAQTPWPEELWEHTINSNEPTNEMHSGTITGECKKDECNNLASRQNVFLVVGDSASVAIDAFVSHERVTSDHTKKWTERFYTVKSKEADFELKNSNNENNCMKMKQLVLINRYYAATVRAYCMHCYWFHPRMAEARKRELLSWTHTNGFALHAYVFATIDMCKELEKLPLTSSTVGMNLTSHWQPSLHDIVEELQSFNINPIIVIDLDDINSSTNNNNNNNDTTDYSGVESKCVSELNAEVILLNWPSTVEKETEEENELYRGTYGWDRLRETLHCVEWRYKLSRVSSYAVPHALRCSKEQTHHINNYKKTKTNTSNTHVNSEVNSCLLSVFGKNAESEEEILYSLLSECFDININSVLSKQAQRNNYKSIMSTVPSFLLQCVADMHGSDVTIAPLLYEITNKYMTALVKLAALGGICTRQDMNLKNAQCVNFSEEYDALLVCCTFEALESAAALITADADSHVSFTTSINNSNDSMSLLLCHAIQSLQSIAVKEVDFMANHYSVKEKEELEPSQAKEENASHLMALFLVDVPVENTVMVEKALQLITSIISTSEMINKDKNRNEKQRNINTCTCESKEKMQEKELPSEFQCRECILFEVIFAEPQEEQNERLGGELQGDSTWNEDVYMAHGMSRVREMMGQHCWRVRKEVNRNVAPCSNEHVNTSMIEVEAEYQEQRSEDVGDEICQSVEQDDAKSTNDNVVNGEQQSEKTFERATCALPPYYLIDPETLKSTPVRVLQYVQEFHRWQSSALNINSSNSTSINDRHEECNRGAEYSHELQMWMSKMNKYGHKLTKAQRQQQAAVLASALEYIDLI